MDLFSVSQKYCERFKQKKNPTYKKIILKNKQKFIGTLTVQYLKINYFIAQLCFVNNYTDFIIFEDFPYLKTVDDESTLFLLKLNKIYELKKNNMFFIPITSEKYKNDKVCFIFSQNAVLDNLILYGQALNPLVEELLMCDISSLLSCQQGKEIQNKMAKAGILQNCYEGFNMRDLNERIMSKSVSQQRMRLQTCDYILRRANILEDQLLVRKPKYTKESNRAK